MSNDVLTLPRLYGEVMAAVGMLVAATAKSPAQFTAGLAIAGWGGGFCQMYAKAFLILTARDV
jgi:hypothetical protein